MKVPDIISGLTDLGSEYATDASFVEYFEDPLRRAITELRNRKAISVDRETYFGVITSGCYDLNNVIVENCVAKFSAVGPLANVMPVLCERLTAVGTDEPKYYIGDVC